MDNIHLMIYLLPAIQREFVWESEKIELLLDFEKISVQLSTEELDILINRIFEYTEKLAKDNSIELTNEEINLQMPNCTIINLQLCLQAQKKFFEIHP